jgi:molybdate transport repressor ModE-like protein
MAIRLTARWHAGESELDVRLVPLLRQVAKDGSLNRAVASLRLSYRHAWGLLGKTERMLGQRLVIMERGRGARLSPFAEKLIEADDTAINVLGRELAATLQALNLETAESRQRPREKPLMIHASHDLALAELRDLLSGSKGAALDLHFRGSLDCLASLARGECDVAGFHLPEPSAGSAAFAPYRPLLGTRGLRLIRFVHRSQGLMVARGNPKRLLKLADLAEKNARFVNRQPESGTRLCFDRLLAAEGLRPAQINGYQTEEFTHAAIAATIASNMADAGFGIEAAARQQALEFVPLADESYFLATRVATLARPALQAVLEALRGSAFRKWVNAHPGYGAAGMGDIIAARDALRADRAVKP